MWPEARLCMVMSRGIACVRDEGTHFLRLQPLYFVQPDSSHWLLAANEKSETESKVISDPHLHTEMLRNKQQNNWRHSEQSFAWPVYVPLTLYQVSAACHSTTGVVVTKPQGCWQSPHLKFQTAIFQVLWIINLQCLWSNEICSGIGV